MSHAQYVLSPWSAQKSLSMPAIDRASGVYLYDDTGKRYLDLSSGLVAVNLGHTHPRVVAAIAEQAGRLCYSSPALFNTKRAELAEELSRISPWLEGCRTFFTTNGAQANEDAMKMARAITGRHKVLAAYRSFHGSTPGAGALSGENRRWPNEPSTMPNIVHFFGPNPYRSPFDTTDPAVECERALAHLELVLDYEDPERVAAIFIEPIVGSNGVVVYPPGYLAGMRALCDAHGILLVFDEVMTGFGRTGDTFAATRFDVTPDLMTIAKGVTSAYVPLGGVMVREGLAKYFDERVLGAGHTYSGHPLAMAAGVAALAAYRDEGLYTRAREIEGWLRDGLSALQARLPMIGDVRGVGAFFALELVRDAATREPLVPWQGKTAGPMPAIFKRLRELGVYTYGRYNCVMVTPPLVIERAELDEGLALVGQALEESLVH
ncbi:MAG: aspartate aminotransferase family protein [Vulcanimicrobiaceae bacterium]